MNWIIMILSATVAGSLIGFAIQHVKFRRLITSSEANSKLNHDSKISEIEHQQQLKIDAQEEQENLKTEKDEDSQQGRRNNQSKRRVALERSLQDLKENENDIDSQYRSLNQERRKMQKEQKQSRHKKAELYEIFENQKSQIIEKLDVNKVDIIQDILDQLHNQVSHERSVWVQHQVEDIEHLGSEMAEDLVDTLVCRLQLKPTVKPQENKINIPDKEILKKAFEEGSDIIEKIQDLTSVELLFNEERTEVKASAYDGVARETCLRLLNRMIQNWKGKEGWFEEQLPQITHRLEREMTRCCGDLMRRLKMEDVDVAVVRMQGRLRFRISLPRWHDGL
jgi:hypothetical protein